MRYRLCHVFVGARRRKMQMPPGSAIVSRRAAILTSSPKISSSSMIISPTCIPMRNSIRDPRGTRKSQCGHRSLDFRGTTSRVHHACEFDQQPVTRGLDNAAHVGGYRGVDQGFSDRFKTSQRAFLVSSHQTAIAGNIRRQDSRKPTLHALPCQTKPPQLETKPVHQSMTMSSSGQARSPLLVKRLPRGALRSPENGLKRHVRDKRPGELQFAVRQRSDVALLRRGAGHIWKSAGVNIYN